MQAFSSVLWCQNLILYISKIQHSIQSLYIELLVFKITEGTEMCLKALCWLTVTGYWKVRIFSVWITDVSELLFFQNWKEKSEVNSDLLMFSNNMLDFVLLAYHPALVRLTIYHFWKVEFPVSETGEKIMEKNSETIIKTMKTFIFQLKS